MAHGTQRNPKACLEALPAELRNIIYVLILQDSESIGLYSKRQTKQAPPKKFYLWPQTKLALTAVSKMFRQDTLKLFYELNTFEYSPCYNYPLSIEDFESHMKGLAEYLRRLRMRGISRVGGIHIDVRAMPLESARERIRSHIYADEVPVSNVTMTWCGWEFNPRDRTRTRRRGGNEVLQLAKSRLGA